VPECKKYFQLMKALDKNQVQYNFFEKQIEAVCNSCYIVIGWDFCSRCLDWRPRHMLNTVGVCSDRECVRRKFCDICGLAFVASDENGLEERCEKCL